MCARSRTYSPAAVDSRLLGIQRHVGEFQPTIWTKIRFRGLTSPFGVVSHCPYHCCARVAQKIRSIKTYRCLHLPPCFQGSPCNVPNHPEGLAGNCRRRSRSLPDLTGHLTARAGGGHALPLGSSGKPFKLTFILPSPLVRFSVLNWIKPHAAPLVVLPRQFL